MNQRVVLYLITVGLLCRALPANAESVLKQIERRGVLKVAIRENAAPFGYLEADGNLQGYCLDFFILLEKQLISKLKRNSLSVKLFKSTTKNRFSLVANDTVDLECGPNTIHNDTDDRVSFSRAFFRTGTQFLVNKNNRNRLDLESNLEDIRLGVIKNTTTEEFIVETYPSASVQRFSGNRARNRGVQAVQQGKIDGMVSDGILLRAEAQTQGLSQVDYPLIPETPLTCDRYGMIIKAKDPQWTEFVNSVINSSAAVRLSQAWFGQLLDYNFVDSASCEEQ